ncbi:Hint domain-containing protein [Jannaschia sp. CCS1]|uniref:Hint domain-containing protein n=1 Tax=Jannaschia sp. (strain CCS1) TaxID=290400 RepID=UPI000053A7DA|nr:Hint domain-containing protein [Jannaschia sp. CCS1]ABD53983.1 Hemolysin-type calcium-binding protein [Jannaschia sp. CCS1]
MATYFVTTSNWNDPSFWSSINQSGDGHSIDFGNLPSNFSVEFDKGSGLVTLSDGTSTFTIGDANHGGSSDATLGGSTQWTYFDNVEGSQGDDSYTGDNSADRYEGQAGDDTVQGGGGDDYLDGWQGDDSIDGEDGDDFIYGYDGNDTISGGAGNDTIDGEDGDDSIDGGSGNDSLSGGGGNDTIQGGDGRDTIDGGSGNDSIDGGGDSDTISGGSGADTIDGGAGDDQISGGDGADVITGGTGDDTIDGGAGADVIHGNDGDDSLDGGTGDDTIHGGDGSDTILLGDDGNSGRTKVNAGDNLQGTTGQDAYEWAGGAGNSAVIRFNLSATAGDSDGLADYVVVTNADDAGTLTIGDFDIGIDTIYIQEPWANVSSSTGDYNGTPFETYTLTYADGAQQTFRIYHDGSTPPNVADIFSTGTSPSAAVPDGNDSVTGGSDADTFVVSDGFGNDTVEGGSGGTDYDTIDLSSLTGPVTVSYSGTEAGTITDGTNTITFSDIEHLTLSDQADVVNATSATERISIDLGAGDDSLTDGDGDDSIIAGDGDDFIMANDGNDTIEGGAGDDDIEGGGGADSIDGGDGNDFIAGYDVAGLAANSERVNTDDGANDTLSGGAGEDTLLGGAGDDDLDGGADNDTLKGGTGNDSLTGGDGDDTFVYNVGDGLDTITDFNAGNSGDLGDGDPTNNDFIDLSAYYDSIRELRADFEDDGILNQSNDTGPGAADYSDNTQMADGEGIAFQNASRNSFSADSTGVVCFTRGTAIRTPRGEVLIEDLRVGDLVDTLDNGPQRLVWIGTREVSVAQLTIYPNLRPIRIQRGVLGNTRKMLVSRQHGMLLGQDHFARAVHLSKCMRGVGLLRPEEGVTYIHLLFESHQVVFAEGIASESFYPGPQALAMMDAAGRAALATHLPTLNTDAPTLMNAHIAYGPPVRAFLAKQEVAEWTLRDRPQFALAG